MKNKDNEIEKRKHYDGIFLFNAPVTINPDETKPPVTVPGFLYSTTEHNETFSIRLESFACYLLAMEKLVAEGGKVIDKDTWVTGRGEVINLDTPSAQWMIYRRMKPELTYRLYEFSQELEYSNDEVDSGLILKPSLLDRYGVSFIESIDIHKNGNRYDEYVKNKSN